MTLHSFLHRLERHHLISRKPHPLIPFLIALAFLIPSFIPSPLASAAFLLFVLSLFFAIMHLIAVKALNRKA